jgi:preprotein translocase subunit SecE
MALADSDSKNKVKGATQGGSVVTNSLSYFADSVAELKRVSFPTRAETTQATIATLVIILFVSVCLFVLDILFGRVMGAILS